MNDMMHNSQHISYQSLDSDRSASIQYNVGKPGRSVFGIPRSSRPKSSKKSNYEDVIRREVNVFRASYLCSQSVTKFGQYLKRRSLHGSAVYIALFLMFLERLAYTAIVGNVTDPFLKSFNIPDIYISLIQTAIFEMAGNILFPIAGFLGDRYLGRFRMAHASMWVLFVGYISLTFTSSFEPTYDGHITNHMNRYLLPICFLIIAMGSAGFQANMIPLGADQIMGRPSDEISSYFYWYYWIRNGGALIFALNLIRPFDYKNTVFGFVSVLSIALGLMVLQFTRKRLSIEQKQHNPYKLVLKVVKFVLSVERPYLRSAFSYIGIGEPSRMDLAKEIHGGRFTNSEVEDVKTFLRLLVFLPSLVGVLTIYTAIVNVIPTQARFMSGSYIMLSQDGDSDSSGWIVNIAFITIAIPIINYGLYPFLREYSPNMRKRIGIGHILAFLSPLVLLILSSLGFSALSQEGLGGAATNSCMFDPPPLEVSNLPVSSMYLLLPHLLISLAEIFIMVSSLEFFYAQSPHTMRGMMIGLFFFTWGIATVVANLVGVVFSNIKMAVLTCDIWYHMLLVVLAIVSFTVFVCVSLWYRNRLRGDIEPDRYYRRK